MKRMKRVIRYINKLLYKKYSKSKFNSNKLIIKKSVYHLHHLLINNQTLKSIRFNLMLNNYIIIDIYKSNLFLKEFNY